MTDPTVAIQKAAADRIVERLTAAGYTTPEKRVTRNPGPTQIMPYVRIGEAQVTPFETKDTEGADSAATFVCWATDPVGALQLAGLVVQGLTDRAAPLTVAGHQLVITRLELRGAPIEDRTPNGPVYYGVPVRVRFITQEA